MSEDLPKTTSDENDMDVDVEDDEVFNDNAEESSQQNLVNNNDEGTTENGKDDSKAPNLMVPELPEFTRKDKTLHEILEMMEDYYPIVSTYVFSLTYLFA